jgi:hypothetical protein
MAQEQSLRQNCSTLASSRGIYTPSAAPPRVHTSLAHLHCGDNTLSPHQVSSSLLSSKTLALLQSHAQISRLHDLASVATSSSLAIELARKQNLQYQQQQLQQQQQQQQLDQLKQQHLKKQQDLEKKQQQVQSSDYITEPSPVDVYVLLRISETSTFPAALTHTPHSLLLLMI